MTPEEIEIKKKRVIANREIIKPNLSLDGAKKYIEEGADPSAQQGKPLLNAVSEDNIEKVKYLLDAGASANIGVPIKDARNLEMIKLLVSYGATLTNTVFEKVSNDYDAIKYLIDNGLDVNFENGLPLRTAAKNNRKDIMQLLLDNGAHIEERRYMVIKWASEHGNVDILTYLLGKLSPKSLSSADFEKGLKDWIHWTKTSDKIDEAKRKEVIALLSNYDRK